MPASDRMNSETEPLYVCAGICRVDYRTSTCIGCGRPVIDTTEPVKPGPIGEQPGAGDDIDPDGERS